MILNLRVDHKLADIQSMEIISKDIDELFAKLQEKYSIVEYIEISTCNRKEYFIHNKHIPEDEELLSHENKSIVIPVFSLILHHDECKQIDCRKTIIIKKHRKQWKLKV